MIFTFDLPLWIKATRIVLETGMRIVVRLVGFNILKNVLGCIGCIMAGAHKNYFILETSRIYRMTDVTIKR